MAKKRKVSWRDYQDHPKREHDVVEAPDDASDADIIDFLDGRRGQGTLKPKIVGRASPNDKPDIVIGRSPDGDLQIDAYNGDAAPL